MTHSAHSTTAVSNRKDEARPPTPLLYKEGLGKAPNSSKHPPQSPLGKGGARAAILNGNDRKVPLVIPRSPRFVRGFLVLVLTAAVIPHAATATDAPPDSAIRVTIRTVDEQAVSGTLRSLSAKDGAVLLVNDIDERRIPFADIVRVVTASRRSEIARAEFTVTLTNGDSLYGDLTTAPPDALSLDTLDLERITVPLEWVARIDSARAKQPAFRDSVEWLDRSGARDEDRVLLTNADTIRGFITAIDADAVAVDAAIGPTVVPSRLFVAARLASPQPRPPKSPHAIATLRSTERLTLMQLHWTGRTLHATTSFGQSVRIEAERLVRLDVVGGRWEWLAAREPLSFAHTPMLSVTFEHVADRNVLGQPMVVGGEPYDRGIGVHSRSTLAYELDGRYRRFVTSFGIDDNSGPLANVTVSIVVDGQRRFELKHVRRGTLHGPVSLDISGANRLELTVDFGDNGDVQDRFNWIEPALIR